MISHYRARRKSPGSFQEAPRKPPGSLQEAFRKPPESPQEASRKPPGSPQEAFRKPPGSPKSNSNFTIETPGELPSVTPLTVLTLLSPKFFNSIRFWSNKKKKWTIHRCLDTWRSPYYSLAAASWQGWQPGRQTAWGRPAGRQLHWGWVVGRHCDPKWIIHFRNSATVAAILYSTDSKMLHWNSSNCDPIWIISFENFETSFRIKTL